MNVLKGQRINIKFNFKGKSVIETHHFLREVYGNECLLRAWTFEWFKRLQEDREDIKDDVRPGRPSTSTTV